MKPFLYGKQVKQDTVNRSGNRVLFAGGIIFVSASNISRRISYYLAN